MLKFKKSTHSDGSITSIQNQIYSPFTQSFGNQQEIRIAIQSQNAYVLPHESSIYIECETVRSATSPNTEANAVLIANFAAFLFGGIRYELNGVEIDACRNVGLTTQLKGLVSYTPNESRGLHTSS